MAQAFSRNQNSSGGVPPEVVLAAVVLALGASVGVWLWSGRAVKPMQAITSVANDIQDGSLDRRIGLEGAAHEVQSLADSFDGMLDRLSRASHTQRQLIEDASHELRTPLAALAVNNEVILDNPEPTLSDYRASAERGEALIARLQLTIDELLKDARTRSQAAEQVDNDLMAIIGRVAAQHRAVHPGVPLEITGPAQLHLGIDGPSVERALVNLVENAARFSPPGVPVEVAVVPGASTQISVTDHGPGIPEDELHLVFDRYYRSGEGSGIGLALVKQVADAHGGIAVESPVPGHEVGSRFTLTLV